MRDLKQQNLNSLRARVHLIHGQHAPLIPASQSVALAAALPGTHSLTLADGLDQVSFSRPPAWFDAWSLACAAQRLLEECQR